MSRCIEADALIQALCADNDGIGRADAKAVMTCLEDVFSIVDDAPSIDIVRCQDCKYWVYHFNGCSRNPCTEPWYATDFCNYGEREGE